MFPKIGQGIAALQFVYLHCEIEMKEAGYAPVCDDRLFDEVLKRNFAFVNGLPGNGAKLMGQGMGIGARGLGKNQKLDAIKNQRCKLAWMKTTPDCQKRAAAAAAAGRRRRSSGFSQPMSLGFGKNFRPFVPT